MRPFLLLGLAPILPVTLAVGQIPVVDGVIGGVPRTKSSKAGSFASYKPRGNLNGTVTTTITPGHSVMSRTLGSARLPLVYTKHPGMPTLPLTKACGFGSSLLDRTPTQLLWRFGSMGVPVLRNEYANMLYIDQPVGAGYSYGSQVVGTSQDAAVAVRKMLQIFFKDPKFSKYATRDSGIWTESYGSHYGPIFVAYFLSQNAVIDAGTVSGVKLNLKVLSTGNGLVDITCNFRTMSSTRNRTRTIAWSRFQPSSARTLRIIGRVVACPKLRTATVAGATRCASVLRTIVSRRSSPDCLENMMPTTYEPSIPTHIRVILRVCYRTLASSQRLELKANGSL
ncbi:hypothetical protein FS749_002842 [Ceratobasidium sp. UAMH 11750]|nr:hypothetical protein FS749_002842 [Ceratobasidium sp. UAMH 11750]